MKKEVKGEIGKSIEERTKQEMANKTESRTIVEDKWEREIQKCKMQNKKNKRERKKLEK